MIADSDTTSYDITQYIFYSCTRESVDYSFSKIDKPIYKKQLKTKQKTRDIFIKRFRKDRLIGKREKRIGLKR